MKVKIMDIKLHNLKSYFIIQIKLQPSMAGMFQKYFKTGIHYETPTMNFIQSKGVQNSCSVSFVIIHSSVYFSFHFPHAFCCDRT